MRSVGRLAAICTGMLALAAAATDCAGLAAVPDAFVSPAQQTAISRFYVKKLWIDDGHSVACPVDVLGAQRIHGRLRVYTVVVCKSFTANCTELTAYTDGLVADLAGTRVVGVFRDDASDEEEGSAEAWIYPQPLRSIALGYIDAGGPRSLWKIAARMAGCPHWTGFSSGGSDAVLVPAGATGRRGSRTPALSPPGSWAAGGSTSQAPCDHIQAYA